MKIVVQSFTIFCLVFGYTLAVPTASPLEVNVDNNEIDIKIDPVPIRSDEYLALNLLETSSTTSLKTTPRILVPTPQIATRESIIDKTTIPSTTVTEVDITTPTTLSTEQKCSEYCTNVSNDIKQQYQSEIDILKNIVIDLMEQRCDLNRGKWVSAENGSVPKGAIVSGWDPDRPYWVARASTGCSVVPCKLTKVHATCWMAWNNTEVRMNKYEVLVDADVKWVQHSSNNPLPKNALIAGHYLNKAGISEKLYIARAYIAEFLVPGYVYEFSRELRHSTRFKNEIKTSYEILVNL